MSDYVRQTWVAGESPLSAERMNHIEDGILGVQSKVTTTASTINASITALDNSKADRTDLTNPFVFKGNTVFASLPTSGNTVNDTYYVTDKKCKYTWNGTAWYVSSIDETDYENELGEVKSDLTDLTEELFNKKIILPKPTITYMGHFNIGSDGYVTRTSNANAYKVKLNSVSLVTLSNVNVWGAFNVEPAEDLRTVDSSRKFNSGTYDINELYSEYNVTWLLVSTFDLETPCTVVNADTDINKKIDNIYSGNLYGKKLYCAGDSITLASGVGNLPNGNKKSYSGFVSYRNHMDYVVDAIGGTCIGNLKINGVQQNSYSVERYLNTPSDADYITIWFGWNDTAYGWQFKRDNYCLITYGNLYSNCTQSQKNEVDSLYDSDYWTTQYAGTVDDTTNDTWGGAWNIVLNWLINNRPNAHIGVICAYGIPYKFKNILISICEKYGIPYIKAYNSNEIFSVGYSDGMSNEVSTIRKNTYTLDGIHPNEKGYELMSNSYEEFLRRI